LDSALTQNTYCFFYHILAKKTNDFNELYGSFACLFGRSEREADLYLNVDLEALQHIVKYVQTGKINGEDIYSDDWNMIDEIIDLATIFGMPNLVSMLRVLHPSEETINDKINSIRYLGYSLIQIFGSVLNHNHELYETEKYIDLLDIFIKENHQSIVDQYIKKNIYGNQFSVKCVQVYLSVFMLPFLTKLLEDRSGQKEEQSQKNVQTKCLSDLVDSRDDCESIEMDNIHKLLDPETSKAMKAMMEKIKSKNGFYYFPKKLHSNFDDSDDFDDFNDSDDLNDSNTVSTSKNYLQYIFNTSNDIVSELKMDPNMMEKINQIFNLKK